MLPLENMMPVFLQSARDATHGASLALRRTAGLAGTAMSTWMRRATERQELLALDWRMRRDARIGPCELHKAVRKPLWRA